MPVSAAASAREILVRLHDVMASRTPAQAKLNQVVQIIGGGTRRHDVVQADEDLAGGGGGRNRHGIGLTDPVRRCHALIARPRLLVGHRKSTPMPPDRESH